MSVKEAGALLLAPLNAALGFAELAVRSARERAAELREIRPVWPLQQEGRLELAFDSSGASLLASLDARKTLAEFLAWEDEQPDRKRVLPRRNLRHGGRYGAPRMPEESQNHRSMPIRARRAVQQSLEAHEKMNRTKAS